MIPGPRPSKGHDRPSMSRETTGAPSAPVALTRTGRGWAVVSPAGGVPVGDLVEGLSLADLVAEEFGEIPEPDRTARRSARGTGGTRGLEDAEHADPRLEALERTVAQLEHALAARVSTERAIGVLAERHGTTPRAAFESLRRDARSSGRPVVELARQVLDGLTAESESTGTAPSSAAPPAPWAASCSCTPVVAATDGRP